MAAAKAVWRSSSGGGDRREPAWILGFKPKRTNLHEKYDYPFLAYYNARRPHSALGYRPPASRLFGNNLLKLNT